MPTTPEILKSIDRNIAAIERELSALLAARHAIDGAVPAPIPVAARRPRSLAAPKPARRDRGPVRADGLEALLASSDGASTAALAEQANAGTDQVLNVLRELERSGRIRRSGERRATRWHVVSHEDQVAARAAEIEARVKAPKRSRATPLRPLEAVAAM
jgi:hypothetical protein